MYYLEKNYFTGSKKRILSAGIGSDEGPSSAKSARSSVGNNSGIELIQDNNTRQTLTSSDLIVDTNVVQCSSACPQQIEQQQRGEIGRAHV